MAIQVHHRGLDYLFYCVNLELSDRDGPHTEREIASAVRCVLRTIEQTMKTRSPITLLPRYSRR